MNKFEDYLLENYTFADKKLAEAFEPVENADMNKYLYSPLGEFSANSGKRHRPLVTALGAQAVGGNGNDALSVAAAIEHFHSAALIHDDIADESQLRRGKTCMYLTEGFGLAINAGDLALSLLIGTVARDESIADDKKVRIIKELVNMTTRTIEGQALDIGWARDNRFDITVEDYLTMAAHKTAYYSASIPLVTGAIVGNGTEEQIAILREFGYKAGLAFQIQDDILNLVGEREAELKGFRGDITEGKRTLIVVHALTESDKKDEIVSILSSHTNDPQKLARAVELFEETQSIEYARQYSLNLRDEAKALIETVELEPQAKELLIAMADFFVSRLA